MNSEPTVYLIQEPKASRGFCPDLSKAVPFGKLRIVFPAGCRVFDEPEKAVHFVRNELASFDPEHDSILWANFGDPAALWLTIMLLVQRGFSKLRFLYWTRGKNEGGVWGNESGYYFPVTLDVSEIERDEEEEFTKQ